MFSFLLIVPNFSLLMQPLFPFLSSSLSLYHFPIASFSALPQVVINNLVYTFSLSPLSSHPLFGLLEARLVSEDSASMQTI